MQKFLQINTVVLTAVLAVLTLNKAGAQTSDTCGFIASYPIYANDGVGVGSLKFVTGRDLGGTYVYFIQANASTPAGAKVIKLNYSADGVLLSKNSLALPASAIGISLDGNFLCADTTSEGIRLSKLSSPGDTLWTHVFGIPGLAPKYITDFGAAGIMVAGAGPAGLNPFSPYAFLLKIDNQQQEMWLTTLLEPGDQGYYYRTIKSSDGGYFAEKVMTIGIYTYEFVSKFDSLGNFLWKTQLGNAYNTHNFGFVSDNSGGVAVSLYGNGFHGPSFICHYFHLDASGNILEDACMSDYVADPENNYFIFNQCPIIPAETGGYLSGLHRAVNNTAPPFVLIRLDENLAVKWTQTYSFPFCGIEPLPGGAFLGFGSNAPDSIQLFKIGANGELNPCLSTGTNAPRAGHTFDFNIQPNPANSHASIVFECVADGAAAMEITLVNPLGQVLQKHYEPLGAVGKVQLQTAALSAGCYALRLKLSNGKTAQKVLCIAH